MNKYILLLNLMNFLNSIHQTIWLYHLRKQAGTQKRTALKALQLTAFFERFSQSVQQRNIVLDNSFFLKVLSQKPDLFLDKVIGSIHKC